MADDAAASQYEILRKRAKQDSNVQTQQEQEGLQRRFAAMGNLNSGAAIRAQSQVEQTGAERLQKANEDIGFQELAENQRRKEVEEGRAFATSERVGAQSFAEAMQGKGFAQAAKEREAGQSFVSQQALDQRKYDAEQGGLNRDFQKGLADQTAGLQKDALNAQVNQFEKQFSADKDVNNINAIIAQVVAGILSSADAKNGIWQIQTKTGSYGGNNQNIVSGNQVLSGNNSGNPSFNSYGLPN